MTNLRIRGKLAMSFAVVLAILTAIGALSIYSQSMLNGAAVSVSQKQVPQLDALATIASSLGNYRAQESAHILAALPDEITAADGKLRSLRGRIERSTRFLSTQATDPATQAGVAAFRTKFDAYMKASDTLLEKSRRNLDIEATDAFQVEEPAFVAVSDQTQKLLDGGFGAVKVMAQDGTQTYAVGRVSTLVGLGIAFAAVGILLVLLLRTIATPLGQMATAMGELGRGNHAVVLPEVKGRDEVADLAGAMRMLRDQLDHAEQSKHVQADLIVASIGAGLERLAQGDLTARIDAELTGSFAKLKTDFNGALDALSGTLAAVSRSTAGIRTGSTEIAQASDDLSRRTEQQAASLEETAAAMDEITATVRETASGAVKANQAVAATRADAETGGRVVAQAVQAMGGIERASNEISEIISVIDGIAFQTNLLALNAGVEAARAGDAGRGFAVVASEVRALAQRSADAAKDVKTKITASAEQVGAGVALVGQTGQALQRIVTRVAEISQLVSQITTSAEQQASGLQQVNTAIGEMDAVTQQNAAMVEQSTAAARSLASEAEELAANVARFRIGEAAIAYAPSRARAEAPAPVAALRRPTPRKIVATQGGGGGRGGGGLGRISGGGGTHGALALKIEPDADDWSQF